MRPDFFGYRAARLLARRGTPEIKKNDQSSLPGPILLKSNEAQIWVDPARSYVSLKYESQTGDRIERVVNEKFGQTPSGVWYPTLTRQEIAAGDDLRFRRWFFVDFDAALPDELFSP